MIDENPADLKEFGLADAAGRGRLQVGRPGAAAADRRQKTPTGSDVYAKLADSKKVFLDPVVSRLHVQSRHVRPARQVGAEARSREDGHAGSDVADRRTDPLREEERRMADRRAGRRHARSSARSTASSRASARLQMKSIVPDASRPEEVRARQAGRDRAHRLRLVAGDARCIGSGAESGTRLREGSRAAGGLHDRVVAPRRPEEGSVRIPAEGPVRRALVQHDAARDRPQRPDHRRSRRPRRRTRTARKRRSGARPRRRQSDVDAAKVEALISAATGGARHRVRRQHGQDRASTSRS